MPTTTARKAFNVRGYLQPAAIDAGNHNGEESVQRPRLSPTQRRSTLGTTRRQICIRYRFHIHEEREGRTMVTKGEERNEMGKR
ncbi:ER lumen protein retaining receptor family protein [Actinidia rufa]|uniref:ER lumen protein retaining receptor family protein n=1 Tax=Actinidia rufa TaxID=165716 RepID=A0A7J0H4K6_9ERIC|nr:ER lumen protein retaining receptor family protein [Actinidia rufa]